MNFRNPFRQQSISWHSQFIQDLAKIIAPDIYAELGIYEGETFNRVTANLRIAVDINPVSLDFIAEHPNVVKVSGDSQKLKEYLSQHSLHLDLLFIDADHMQDSVISDFTILENFMSQKGLILLHDTFPGSPEMASAKYCGDGYLAVPRLRKLFPNWNFVTLPIHPGLTIASKIDSLPPWVNASDF